VCCTASCSQANWNASSAHHSKTIWTSLNNPSATNWNAQKLS
jgi:hypothetical protein